MKKIQIITLGLALALFLTACGSSTQPAPAESLEPDKNTLTVDTSYIADMTDEDEMESGDMFTQRDLDASYDESKSALISLNGSSVACDSDAVEISGSTVTITDEGTYILSGTLDDGMIIVNAEKTDKTQLVFDGAAISSATTAPVYIQQADKVFITLAEGTVNTLSNSGTFIATGEDNIDAAIFSKEDITFNGSGSLAVSSPGGHGVVSKDDLVFTGGVYEITAAAQGVSGKDSVRTVNASFTIDAGKDGLHAENADDPSLGFIYIESGSFSISARGDGISASAAMEIQDGSFDIHSGGGSGNTLAESEDSGKGMKAGGNLTVNGGSFTIDSADDGVHSNAALTVSNGVFTIATGDDGFHADENLSVIAGTIKITESYEGLEGLNVAIMGGAITVYASDDGINAAGGKDQSGFGGGRGNDRFGANADSYIDISGGTIYIHASGDGMDSNGSLTVSGGDMVISTPTKGDTAILDYASSGSISGGKFVGTGASMMSMGFGSSSTQGVIMANTGAQSAGTIITLTDAQGNTLISRETDQDFTYVILSCPEIIQGVTYTLTVGSTEMDIEMTELIYNANTNGGIPFGEGGRPGGQGGRGGRGGRQDGGEPPEGMERPEGLEPPEGMEPPADGGMPQGGGRGGQRPGGGGIPPEIPDDQAEAKE